MNHKKKKVIRMCGLPLLSIESEHITRRERLPADGAIRRVRQRTGTNAGNEAPIFVINSMMLQECFDRATETEDENIVLVTGSRIGRLRCLERVVPVSLQAQSAVGAVTDASSLAEGYVGLYEYGLMPAACFHSHPGYGIEATHPSGTDMETQTLFERSGGTILGGIFSRDGYIRFYAKGDEPNVQVVGKKVEEVKKNLYRLDVEQDIPLQSTEGTGARRRCG